MNPLETHLNELTEIRSTGAGTPETSYYGALLKELKANRREVIC